MDGNIPNIRVFLCNNGGRWEANGEALITEAGLSRTTFKHINHNHLIDLLQKKQPINAGIRLSGKMFVENFDHRRVLIGRVPVKAIAELFEHHGDKLLDRNIRRYLGLRDNRVNLGIYSTLEDIQGRGDFYFFNNGITAICTKFTHNEFQSADQQIKVEGFQIVNGGQTSKTIQRRIADDATGDYSRCSVLLRLYELADAEDDLVNNITFATNSQNPVDLADLRSNDVIHDKISIGLKELGFDYKRKRDDSASGPDTITVSVAAEAVMAAWRRKPHAAKFRRSRLFGDLYEEVFAADLQPAHVLLSVLIFRLVESERRRRSTAARFVPYASHFLTMVVGDLLLKKLNLERSTVSHENIPDIRTYFESNKKSLYEAAVSRVGKALKSIGITEKTPLPRVAAQFRRGDLLEPLQQALTTLAPPTRKRRKAA